MSGKSEYLGMLEVKNQQLHKRMCSRSSCEVSSLLKPRDEEPPAFLVSQDVTLEEPPTFVEAPKEASFEENEMQMALSNPRKKMIEQSM